jgi:hypothetical protein
MIPEVAYSMIAGLVILQTSNDATREMLSGVRFVLVSSFLADNYLLATEC